MSGRAFGTAPIGFRYGAANAMAWLPDGRIVVAHGSCVSFLDGTKLGEGLRVHVGSTLSSLSVGPTGILVCTNDGDLVMLDGDTLEEKSRVSVKGARWATLGGDGVTAAIVLAGKNQVDELDWVRVADGASLTKAGAPPIIVSAGAVISPALAAATLSWWGVEIARPKPAPGARIEMGDVSCHAFASDETAILGTTAGTVRRVDLRKDGSHETAWEVPLGKSRTRCVYAAHGFVGVADDDGATALLSLVNGKELVRWKVAKGIRVVFPSPDGKRALVVSQAAGNVLAPTRLSIWVPGKAKAAVSKTSGAATP